MLLFTIRPWFQLDNRKMLNENFALLYAGERIISKFRSQSLHSKVEMKKEGDQ